MLGNHIALSNINHAIVGNYSSDIESSLQTHIFLNSTTDLVKEFLICSKLNKLKRTSWNWGISPTKSVAKSIWKRVRNSLATLNAVFSSKTTSVWLVEKGVRHKWDLAMRVSLRRPCPRKTNDCKHLPWCKEQRVVFRQSNWQEPNFLDKKCFINLNGSPFR